MSRILIVDDDQDVRALLHTILTKESYEVMNAKDAFEARDLLDTYSFDAAIIDINMPNKNGFKLLTELRQSLRYKNLPVGFLSARQDLTDIKRARNLGVSCYLIKPINKVLLLERVSSLLKEASNRSQYQYDVPIDEVKGNGKIVLQAESRIISVTDTGATIITNLNLLPEQLLVFNCPLFTEMGIEPSSMIVNSIKGLEGRPGFYSVFLNFQRLSPEETLNIKNWLSKDRTKKAA